MADVYTDNEDELTISQVINSGFGTSRHHKYLVLRLALARSLRLTSPPEDEFDFLRNSGSEYSLEQITGKGKNNDEAGVLDFDNVIISLLDQ